MARPFSLRYGILRESFVFSSFLPTLHSPCHPPCAPSSAANNGDLHTRVWPATADDGRVREAGPLSRCVSDKSRSSTCTPEFRVRLAWSQTPIAMTDGVWAGCPEVAVVACDGRRCHLCLPLHRDSGQEEYERLRPMSYSKSHVILIAFAIDTPDSLDNVTVKVRYTPL